MNIDTGEIKDADALTDAEKASGRWNPLTEGSEPNWAKHYLKQLARMVRPAREPRTPIDFARIAKAEAKRARKAARR